MREVEQFSCGATHGVGEGIRCGVAWIGMLFVGCSDEAFETPIPRGDDESGPQKTVDASPA